MPETLRPGERPLSADLLRKPPAGQLDHSTSCPKRSVHLDGVRWPLFLNHRHHLSDRWRSSAISQWLAPAVNDHCCCENLCLVADTSISRSTMVRELDALIRVYSKPTSIVSNNRTEVTSRAILQRANDNDIDWLYIDPCKPQQSAFIESVNCSPRDELLKEKICDSLEDARRRLALWGYDDNKTLRI